jgi:DNA-dependent RNA polymerase auxiliary subunit epsilon
MSSQGKFVIYYDDDAMEIIEKMNEALSDKNLKVEWVGKEGDDFMEYEIQEL